MKLSSSKHSERSDSSLKRKALTNFNGELSCTYSKGNVFDLYSLKETDASDYAKETKF